jgi:hypothetical protein
VLRGRPAYFLRRQLGGISACFGFYGTRTCALLALIPALAVATVLTFLAFRLHSHGWAIAGLMIAVVFLLTTCCDSGNYLYTLLRSSSDGRGIEIVKKLDPLLREAITNAERAVFEADANSVDRTATNCANALLSDFRQRPLFPRVAGRLLGVIGTNLLLTIAGFALLAMNVTLLAMNVTLLACGGTQRSEPYGHHCIDLTKDGPGDFTAAAFHFFYYESVVFHTVGDGAHTPATEGAQAVAIFAFFTYLFYVVVMFGGTLSAIMFVHSEFTPGKLCEAARGSMLVVVSDRRR